MKVTAVVVTYNRKPLLQRTIAALRAQSRQPDAVIVIDNGSTDDTEDWLAEQEDLTAIRQDNCGGSGGFHRGIDEAMRTAADWIWCMDDDVFPRRECLERLLEEADRHTETGILAPRRLQAGRIFCHDFTDYNLTQTFASMYVGRLSKRHIDRPTPIAGTAFEGLLVRRDVVARIGLPNRELFIFCDDTDYCLRAHQAGFGLLYVPAALMDKELFFADDSWAQREAKKKWKRYYQVRNAAYLNHHYGRSPGVRHVRSLIGVAGYIATALFTAPFSRAWSFGDIPRLWRAYRDGVHERLGKM